MSERLTDEQVADLADPSLDEIWGCEDVNTLAREVQEYRALRPTCPTCNGTCVATRALMPATPSTCIHCEQTITLHGNSRWYHTGGWECCRLGSPSSPVATPPIVEGDVPCPDCTDGKLPLDRWVDRLLAQCVRQRALFDDLRACPTTIAVPRLIATSDDVNSWPFVVEVPRATWDALHAIGGES